MNNLRVDHAWVDVRDVDSAQESKRNLAVVIEEPRRQDGLELELQAVLRRNERKAAARHVVPHGEVLRR